MIGGLVRRWFARGRPGQAPDPADAAALARAIDVIDPRLRLVAGHGRQLGPAAARSWRYARDFVGRLPAALEISPRRWNQEPALRMLFASARDITAILASHPQIGRVFSAHPEADCAYFLLGVGHKEKQVFGMEMAGDLLRQDVAQRVLSFFGHHVAVVGTDEASVRARLERQVYDALLNQALQRISLQATRRAGLERQRALLKTRLRILRGRADCLDGMFDPDARLEAEEVEAAIERSTRELMALRSSAGTLQYTLRQARKVLLTPERYLRMHPWSARVDAMNRLLPAGAPPPCYEATFLEASLGSESPRAGAILLGRLPRAEWVPPSLKLQDAHLYL